jgi:hypothetical protein
MNNVKGVGLVRKHSTYTQLHRLAWNWKNKSDLKRYTNMEEQITTPVEDAGQNIETVEQTPDTAAQQTATETNDVGPEQQPAQTEGQRNWNNGRRRIQQRQSAKARIKELEERLAQYEGKTDDYSRFQAQQLQDRIGDMTAMNADAEANEFADEASKFFGEDTPSFMQDVYRYAPYVNQNEPDLLKYSRREYGPILLHEWMQRMDNPQLRAQWLNMTTFEKQKVLDNFYRQIDQVVKSYGKQQPQQPKPANVPVPSGGRQSPSSEPSDDFGVEFGRAFNRHKGQ